MSGSAILRLDQFAVTLMHSFVRNFVYWIKLRNKVKYLSSLNLCFGNTKRYKNNVWSATMFYVLG